MHKILFLVGCVYKYYRSHRYTFTNQVNPWGMKFKQGSRVQLKTPHPSNYNTVRVPIEGEVGIVRGIRKKSRFTKAANVYVVYFNGCKKEWEKREDELAAGS